jgi:hypothetical protein
VNARTRQTAPENAPPPAPEVWLTSGDLARERGITRQSAWAWLKCAEAEFGASVVHRIDGRLYITRHGLETVAIARGPSARDMRVDRRLSRVEEAVGELEAKGAGQASEFSVWKRKVAALEALMAKVERTILGKR